MKNRHRWLNLQLFASTKSSTTNTQQQTANYSQGGEHSSSSTQYGSVTDSATHTQGGSTSISQGKSWLSGQVDQKTQQGFDKLKAEYEMGAEAQATKDRLQATIDAKPGSFTSIYQPGLDEIYNKIMDMDAFSYDFNQDAMYNMYADKYQADAKRAMQDTAAQMSSQTAGYGSSWSGTQGQQAYQNTLNQLNTTIIPELRNQRYQEWQATNEMLKDQYAVGSDAWNREYGQYRDEVGDWQWQSNFDQNAYNADRQFDFNTFAADRGFFQDEFWNQRKQETSNYQQTDTNYWEDSQTHSETNGWSNTETNGSSWGMNMGNTIGSSTVNYVGAGGSGGSGSGSGTSSAGNFQLNPDYVKRLENQNSSMGQAQLLQSMWDNKDNVNKNMGENEKLTSIDDIYKYADYLGFDLDEALKEIKAMQEEAKKKNKSR